MRISPIFVRNGALIYRFHWQLMWCYLGFFQHFRLFLAILLISYCRWSRTFRCYSCLLISRDFICAVVSLERQRLILVCKTCNILSFLFTFELTQWLFIFLIHVSIWKSKHAFERRSMLTAYFDCRLSFFLHLTLPDNQLLWVESKERMFSLSVLALEYSPRRTTRPPRTRLYSICSHCRMLWPWWTWIGGNMRMHLTLVRKASWLLPLLFVIGFPLRRLENLQVEFLSQRDAFFFFHGPLYFLRVVLINKVHWRLCFFQILLPAHPCAIWIHDLAWVEITWLTQQRSVLEFDPSASILGRLDVTEQHLGHMGHTVWLLDLA